MALQRKRIMSPNFSGRGGTGVRLIVLHTAEGATTIESLGNFFANPGSGVSSHAGADDQPGVIGEYVDRPNKAWTQGNANPYSVSIELCAFAGWGPSEWAAHPVMLENTAKWIAEEAAAFGIPIVRTTDPNGTGVCMHVDLGSAGGGHWDCGPDFPINDVIAMASGSPVTPGAPPASTPPSGGGGAAPPWPGTYLQNFTQGGGTAQWQGQMAARGWNIGVDDMYGDQSEDVCRSFQAEKGLAVDGVVGPDTWAAAWTAPVT
jgi:hypothetical protein